MPTEQAAPPEDSGDPLLTGGAGRSPVTDTTFPPDGPFESDSGVEDERDSEEITTPFSPERIRITTKPVVVQQILSRIRDGAIDLNPDFQRLDEAWDPRRRSRLIESLLLRIPIPAFYVSVDKTDTWRVVDGVQRISTIHRFVRNEFPLRGLEYLLAFQGKRHDGLPRYLQRRIDETTFGFHIIEPGTPPEVMFNIFTRLNTGGKPLNRQEIRNALHPGPVREYLKRLAGSDSFLRATNGSVNPRRMADRELVLRFLAFHIEPWEQYAGSDLDGWLGTVMDRISAMDEPTRARLERDFTRAMDAAFDVFGDLAFRRPVSPESRRQRVNRALFDSWSVGLARRADAEIEALVTNRNRVVEGLRRLLDDDTEFRETISWATGDAGRVQKRFRAVDDLIRRCLPGVSSA